MLEETRELLAKANNLNKIKQIKQAKRKASFIKYKKIAIRIVIGTIFVSMLFFPVETGTIIGKWINDFFVTIYKNIIK